MKFEIELPEDSDAEQAYERILETLSQQAGRDVPPEEHAELVLREHIAQQYGQLVVNGDPTEQPQGIKDALEAE